MSKELTKINKDPEITSDCITTTVILAENGLAECVISANNQEGKNYLAVYNLYDDIEVRYAYEEDGLGPLNSSGWDALPPVFRGKIIELSPNMAIDGEVVQITAIGKGHGLKQMRVANEYGEQSRNGIDNHIDYNDTLYVRDFDGTFDEWDKMGNTPYLDEGVEDNLQLVLNDTNTGKMAGWFEFAEIEQRQNMHFDTLWLEIRAGVSNGKQCYLTATLSDGVHSPIYLPPKEITSLDWYIWDLADAIDVRYLSSYKLKLVLYGYDNDSTNETVLVDAAVLYVQGIGYAFNIKTIREILTDSTYGIIPAYVEKILGTAANSGYTLGSDYIYNDPSIFPYLNFPYEDAFMALQDIIRIGSSLHYVADPDGWTGLHWIVDIDGNLLLAPIGNHDVSGINDSCNIEDKWPTYALEGEPLLVREDMIIQGFKTELPLANYVLVAGNFVLPMNEEWTEGHKELWTIFSGVLYDDFVYHKVGNSSLHSEGLPVQAPLWTTIIKEHPNVDIYAIGSNKNIPHVDFFGRRSSVGTVQLIVGTGTYNDSDLTDDYFFIDITAEVGDEEWSTLITKKLGDWADSDTWGEVGSPDWHQIDYIGFRIHKGETVLFTSTEFYVDGFGILGSVIRGAYDSTSIDQYNCRFLTVRDSLASQDNLDTDDDTSPLAQTALYELLRNRLVRTSGQITIPLTPGILPGQLVWIRSSYIPDGENFDLPDVDQSGTIVYTHNSNLMTGENTKFTTIKEGMVQHCADSNNYTVTKVINDTAMYVDRPYVSGDGSGNLLISSSYMIDRLFRITEVKHLFLITGALTQLTLIDDLKNSIPINTVDPYSITMRCINPDYQTRTYASLKSGGDIFNIDLIPISKDYPS